MEIWFCFEETKQLHFQYFLMLVTLSIFSISLSSHTFVFSDSSDWSKYEINALVTTKFWPWSAKVVSLQYVPPKYSAVCSQ